MKISGRTTTATIRSFRWIRTAFFVLAIPALTAGCATLNFGDDGDDDAETADEDIETLEADPILIRADEDGEVEHLDAEEVFERAYYDFQARRYEDAADDYRIIIEHFDETRFYRPSLYNGGLAFEELDRWGEAVEAYELLIANFPDSDEALNAEFRLANAHYELGDYETSAERMTELLLDDDLEHFDRVEAHVRRGKALLELEQWTDAENSFNNAIELNERATPSERLDEDSRHMVLAQFGRGQAYHGRMNDIPLVLPPERMEEDLEDKADYHQTAQAAYIRALRQHHPHWSVAAGYKIGKLYQDFYLTIFTAEIPDDLTDEELAFYFEELREKIDVLMERALNVYERNLSFSRRVASGADAEEWVEATSKHLERMRAFLDDPLVQERAEKLVIERGDLEDLWDTGYYARRHVGDAFDRAIEETSDSEETDEVARH